MDINSKLRSQVAALDDTDCGEGLSIFFSQNGDDTVRYRFLVKVKTDQGLYDIGEFYSSPPLATPTRPGRLSRMLAAAVCPGAVGWSVEVEAMPAVGVEVAIPPEVAKIILNSSKCCTAPVGVHRVNERYLYSAGSVAVATNIVVPPGRTVTGIAVIGHTGGGIVSVGGGDTITVPENVSMNLQPGAHLPPNALISLDDVDYVIEYLESA